MKEQKKEKKNRSKESSRQPRLPPDDNRRARDNQRRAGEICPEGPHRKPGRADPDRKSLDDEMLNAERHHSRPEEIGPKFEERISRFALSQWSSAGKNPGAPTHCQSHKSAGPLVPIARMGDDPGDMKHHDKKQKHHSQQSSSRSRHSLDDSAYSGCHKSEAHQVGPK